MKKHRLDTKALKHGKPKGPAKPPPLPNVKARPNHKKAIVTARLNAENSHKRPEPMFTFAKRTDKGVSRPVLLELDALEGEKLKREATAGRVERAARASAEWNNSDPFAYGRTALHVRQGFVDPEKLEVEFRQRTVARRAARAKEVDDAKRKTA